MRTLPESKEPGVCNRCTKRFAVTLREQQAEAAKLDVAGRANINGYGYGD